MTRLDTKRCSNWGTGAGKTLSRIPRISMQTIGRERRRKLALSRKLLKAKPNPVNVSSPRNRGQGKTIGSFLMAMVESLSSMPFIRRSPK